MLLLIKIHPSQKPVGLYLNTSHVTVNHKEINKVI